jgi:hypothetical protein
MPQVIYSLEEPLLLHPIHADVDQDLLLPTSDPLDANVMDSHHITTLSFL